MCSYAQYLQRQIINHVKLFFDDEALAAVVNGRVKYVPYDDAAQMRRKAVCIPTDIEAPCKPHAPYKAPFNGTKVTLWNRLPMPDDAGWKALPDIHTPIWYKHESGTLIPAFNFYGNLTNLLLLKEERSTDLRDKHERFIAAFSPRLQNDMLEVPAFNEAAAILVDGLLAMAAGCDPMFKLPGYIRPAGIVLSHDCDQLRGNDGWTQAVRAYRIFRPLASGKLPRLQNAWWIARNYMRPEEFYLGNVLGMIDIERMFGFTSVFYFLNGNGGRYGARSGAKSIAATIPCIPEEWETGMHYNYDTYFKTDIFDAQKDELERLLNRKVLAGRAHYLRFDPEWSFAFLQRKGIEVDESLGYSDRIGYRCGIAGIFQGFDFENDSALDIYEIPMTIMEATLLEQYKSDPVGHFRDMIQHLRRVGGAISLCVHPGMFHNPEFPETNGFYFELLKTCYQAGMVSHTPGQLREKIGT